MFKRKKLPPEPCLLPGKLYRLRDGVRERHGMFCYFDDENMTTPERAGGSTKFGRLAEITIDNKTCFLVLKNIQKSTKCETDHKFYKILLSDGMCGWVALGSIGIENFLKLEEGNV